MNRKIFTYIFLIFFIMIHPLAAMNHKYQLLPDEKTAQEDRKVVQENRNTNYLSFATASQPAVSRLNPTSISIAPLIGDQNRYMAAHNPMIDMKIAQEDQKSHHEMSASVSSERCAMPPNSSEKSPSLKWNIDDSQKIPEFRKMISNADKNKNTQTMYNLAKDPIIKKFLQDEKSFFEANSIKDDAGKTMLDHAIAHDDAPFIGPLARFLTTHERDKAIRSAATQNKPRALLVLIPPKIIPATPQEIDENKKQKEENQIALIGDKLPEATSLLEHFKTIQDLTVAELTGYETAMKLAKRYQQLRANYTWKIINKLKFKKHPIPSEWQTKIHGMINTLHHIPNKMHPELYDAIMHNRFPKIKRMLMHQVDLTAQHRSMDALELAAMYGWIALPIMLLENQNISLNKKINLLRIIQQRYYDLFQCVGDEKIKEILKENFEIVINFLKFELPNLRRECQKTIKNQNEGAIFNTGSFLYSLSNGDINANGICPRTGNPLTAQILPAQNGTAVLKLFLMFGANPNAIYRIPNQQSNIEKPLLWIALFEPPEQMELLLEYGADPDTCIRDSNTGEMLPLLYWAMEKNKPQHFKILLKFKATTHTKSKFPLTYCALFHDPQFLEMLLKHGMNPNEIVTGRSHNGKNYPILIWAAAFTKPQHFKLLLEHGANAKVISMDGYPTILGVTRLEDPTFLEELLKHGAEPNDLLNERCLRGCSTSEESLLISAIHSNRPQNFRSLLRYGADLPNTRPAAIGTIVFDHTAESPNPAFLRIILEHNTQPNVRNKIKISGIWHLDIIYRALFAKGTAIPLILKLTLQNEKDKKKEQENNKSCCTIM